MMKNSNRLTRRGGENPVAINCKAKVFGVVTAVLLLLCATVLGCIFFMPKTATVVKVDTVQPELSASAFEGVEVDLSSVDKDIAVTIDNDGVLTTTGYDKMSEAWNAAINETALITLLNDVTVDSKPVSDRTGTLKDDNVLNGVNAVGDVMLDLNGHIFDLDTNEDSGAVNWFAIGKDLTFTLSDSNPEADNTITVAGTGEQKQVLGGVITGFDCVPADGSYVYSPIMNSGNTTIIGGGIAGNRSKQGGGVYASGTVSMTGGTISYNYSTTAGGGVFVASAGKFNLSGLGNISYNNAGNTGGGVYDVGGTFKMSGGEISHNTAQNGSGVYSCGTLNLSGGKISHNLSTNDNTGAVFFIRNGDNFTLSGTTEIADNMRGNDTFGNLYISMKFNVGKLESGAKIGVTYSSTSAFTNGYPTNNPGVHPSTYFFADSESKGIDADSSGEVKLVNYVATIPVEDGEPVKYTDFAAAWNAALAKATATVQMLSDATLTNQLATVVSGKTITLDLNGKKLNLNGESGTAYYRNIIVDGGTLILKDSLPTSTNTIRSAITDGNVQVSGGVITGGYYKDSGGAVRLNSGTFEMNGGTIAGNNNNNSSAKPSNYSCTAVHVSGGTFNMTDGAILHTKAANGIVYLKNGTFNMSGGKIANNRTTSHGSVCVDGGVFNLSGTAAISDNIGYMGSGVYVGSSGTFEMTGGTISGNSTTYLGSGVHVTGTFKMSGGTIVGNKHIGSSGGGGVYASNCTVELSGNPVIKDNVGKGGTVDSDGNIVSCGENPNLYLERGDSNGNQQKAKITGALTSGAHISVSLFSNVGNVGRYTGVFTVDYGSYEHDSDNPQTHFFADNAEYSIDIRDGEVAVTNHVVEYDDGSVEKICDSFEDAWKAAQAVTSGTVTLTLLKDAIVASDAADLGRLVEGNVVIFDLNGHVLNLNGSSSKSRYLNVYGGNLTLKDSVPTAVNKVKSQYDINTEVEISGGVITGGYASQGGGVSVLGGTFNMIGGAISGNYATSNGGGVYVGSGTFAISKGTISENNASDSGGGVYVDGGSFDMTGGIITRNRAYGNNGNGGGVCVRSGSFTMTDGKVYRNSSYNSGGGVAVIYSGTFTMSDAAEISNNYATSSMTSGLGGGVLVYGSSSTTPATFNMNGGRISDNSGYRGGGVYLNQNAVFNMTGGTITGNVARTNGNGGGVQFSTINTAPKFNISGNPVIEDNYNDSEKTKLSNVYVSNYRIMTVVGALDDSANIGVTHESGTGKFTDGYSDEEYNNSDDPSDYFFSDSLKKIILDNGEAKIVNEEVTTRTVRFYGEDDALLQTKLVAHGQKVTYTGVLPTKENTAQYTYTFGWYKKNGATYTPFDIVNTAITDNLDLYGRFTETLNNYEVSISSPNGFGTLSHSGITVPCDTVITFGNKQLTVGNTTVLLNLRTDEVFVEWNVNGEAAEGSSYTVIGNTEVEAIVKKKVSLEWTYKNENVNTREYNGESDKGEIKVALKDFEGKTVQSFTGLNAEVNMVATGGATALKNVGTYTFSLVGSDSFNIDKYDIETNEFVFSITPYVVDLATAVDYKWTLAGMSSVLRDGTVYAYTVDGSDKYFYIEHAEYGEPKSVTPVLQSIARFRDRQLTVGLNTGNIPTDVDYSTSGTRSATEIGRYTAIVDLTLTDSVNYKYVLGTVDPRYGTTVTVDYVNGKWTAHIEKVWYILTIGNGLIMPTSTAEDPVDYYVADFTFGGEVTAVAPALEHGTISDSNATFKLLRIGANGKAEQIGESFVYSEFADYINQSMPAGKYVLAVSVDSVTENDIVYESFPMSFDFTVEKAELTVTTDGLKGKALSRNYSGELIMLEESNLNVALLYDTATKRSGEWAKSKYDSYYGYEVSYNIASWNDSSSYRTLEQLSAFDGPKPINAGDYKVYYRITSNNYNAYGGDAGSVDGAKFFYTVKINPIAYDTDEWGFEKDEYKFTYTGAAQLVEVKDNLPSGVTVSYIVTDKDGNVVSRGDEVAVVNAGNYTVTAAFAVDGNHVKPSNCTTKLVISPKEIDVSGVSFADMTVAYNGSAQSLTGVSGLPDGVLVTYSNNSFTDPGKYGVVATLVPTDNNHVLVGKTKLDANLFILESELVVYVDGTNTVWLSARNVNGFPIGTKLNIRLIEGYTSNLIESTIGAAFDITLVGADGNAIQPNGSITLRLLIPEALRSLPEGNTLGLMHVHGGAATELTIKIDGNYAECTTDSLSAFVFVQKTAPVKPAATEPEKNDLWWIWIVIGVLALLIIILLLVLIFRKKNKEENAALPAPIDPATATESAASADLGNNATEAANRIAAAAAMVAEAAAKVAEAKINSVQAENAAAAQEAAVEVTPEPVVTPEIAPAPAQIDDEITPEVDDDDPEVPSDDGFAGAFDASSAETVTYSQSVLSKLISSTDAVKNRYSELKNYLLSYKKARANMSRARESFYIGRNCYARIAVRGKTLCVYLALDPQKYAGTKYNVEDVLGVKSYADTPCLIRIKSERALKYAKELIDELMHNIEAEKSDRAPSNYVELFKSIEMLQKKKLISCSGNKKKK
ncbi:MAG: hypothetical protein K2O04_05135 [Clostridiales bacterium]|nr:hypothetical protein [Clostridiales bacterium]